MENAFSYLQQQLSKNNIIAIFKDSIIKKPTVGVDRINVEHFNKSIAFYANQIEERIQNMSYRFSPFQEKLVLKGRGKTPRTLCIPTIRDKIVLIALKNLLHEIYPNAVNRELINLKVRKIFSIIHKSEFHILKSDFSLFYDSLNQYRLINIISKKIESEFVLSLIKNSITNPIVPRNYKSCDRDKYKSYIGIPQGLPISNVLANIYLDELDTEIREMGIEYYRYVDDVIIISDEKSMSNVKNIFMDKVKSINLTINQEKTNIYKPKELFSYLGYLLSSEAIIVKPESVQRHIDVMFALISSFNAQLLDTVKRPRYLTNERLLNRIESDINEKITGAISEKKKYGWIFYFSAISNTNVLHRLNKIIKEGCERIFGKDVCSHIKLKSYVRAFYETTHNPQGGYIHDYDNYDDLIKRISYLTFRGYLDDEHSYSVDEINELFSKIRNKHITDMQFDLGNIS